MGNIVKISRYYITNSYRLYLILIAGALVVHLVASVAVDRFLGPERDAGIVTFFVLCAGCILGAATFAPSFRYLLSQGISRKIFSLATGVSLAAVSVIFAAMIMIYYAITLKTVHSTSFLTIYEGLYHSNHIFSMLVWESGLLFLLGMLGWLISLVYYRLGRLVRAAASGGFVVFWIIIATWNKITDGLVLQKTGTFLKTILGFDPAVPNPYIAVLSFVVIALILFGFIFLLIRRAQVTH